MIISNSQIKSLLSLYARRDSEISRAPRKEAEKVLTGDAYKVAISADVQAYTAVRDAIMNLPDIREDRLIQIEKMVKSGTYEVNDEEVAEKMLGRTLVDKLV